MSITEPTTAQEAAAAPHVAVVGNICLDVVIRGLSRLPEWGQEVSGDDSLQAPGGQGFNASVALAALRVKTSLVGMIGRDAAGEMMRAQAAADGVAVEAVWTHPELPSAVTAALVREDGERAFASDFGCQREWTLRTVNEQLATLPPVTHVLLAGLFNIPGFDERELATFFRAVREDGLQVILDTGWDPLGWQQDRIDAVRDLLQHVDWFLPNLDEGRAITGVTDRFEVAQALHECCAGAVVVKCGSEGSIGLTRAGGVAAGVLPVDVVDAVGAGDTFDAGFIAGLVNGIDLEGSMRLATAAAALRLSRGNRDRRWPDYAQAGAAAADVAIEPLHTEQRR